MAKTAILAIRIISDATKAAKGFQQAEKSSAKFERRLGKANKAALGVVGGLAAIGTAAFNQASAVEQSAGAVEAVFKKQAKQVKSLGDNAADSLGLAASEYQNLAAVFGAQLKNMGTATKQLVPTTDKLIVLGGDLAATFGGSTADAVGALSSLLRGERDPIERYGVSIKQADINARLAAKGQDKLTGAAKTAANTEATLALLYEQTAAAQGQRTRESNTAAQQQERAVANLKNAGAKLGKVLVPVVAAIAAKLAVMAAYVGDNSKAFTILGAAAAAVAVAVFAVNAAYRVYQATLLVITAVKKASVIVTGLQTAATYVYITALVAAQLAANAFAAGIRLVTAAMRANPLGLAITALTIVGGLFVLAYKKSATFRAIVQATGKAASAALGWIVDKAKSLWDWLKKLGPAANKVKTIGVAAFKAYTTPIRTLIDLVIKLIGWIKKIKFPKVPKAISKIAGGIGGLFGSADQYPGAVARGGSGYGTAPSVFAAPGQLMAASPTTITLPAGGRNGYGYGNTYITITGAIDPVATAKQIRSILRDDTLRRGAAA